MKKLLNSALIFTGLTLSITSQAAVWQTTQQWTPQMEEKYSNWVEQEYSKDIYMVGKYKGIPTDCADAVYGARMIFAFENGLPFAVRDLTGSLRRHTLITNEMSRFDRYKDPIKRLKKFFSYIADITNTKSISYDTYPVQVNRTWVKPGIAWVRARRTATNVITGVSSTVAPGHAELVKHVRDTGVIFTISSTVPQGLRNLKITSGLGFFPGNTKMGLRHFLQPNQYFTKSENLPGYSLEQYKFGFDHKGKKQNLKRWKKEIRDRLKLRDESKDEMIQRYADNLCAKMIERVAEVQKGERKRQAIGRCMNAREFDLYSTPSRDKKIKHAIEELVRTNFDKGFITKRKMKTFLPYLKKCEKLEYKKGKTIDIIKAMRAIYKGKASSNPNQKIDARWGMKRKQFLSCKKFY